MTQTLTCGVPAVQCESCAMPIRQEVSEVGGVSQVDVDPETRAVTVRGRALHDAALRAAIEAAGYQEA